MATHAVLPPSRMRGLDDRIKCVGDQVGERVDRGDHHHAGLQQRQVVLLDREHEKASETGIGEHRLDHYDAAHQDAGVDREHGDRRQQCVGQCVAPQHKSLGQAFGTRRKHVAALQGIQHRGASQSRNMRDESTGQHQHGQQQMR
jgi:hypothetical protein